MDVTISLMDSVPVISAVTIDFNLALSKDLLNISPIFPIISGLPFYFQ
jgi:hypothetical protein